jgi:hypothetical protein
VLRLVVWLLLLAVMLYAFFWVLDRRSQGPEEPKPPKRRTPKGPVGPDDDEAFLRELERRRRQGDGPQA